MSQPPPDPFVPGEIVGPETPPPIPAAVRVRGPMDVLTYTQPVTIGRPGIVGAIGIASVVIGCLTILASGFSTFMTLGLFIAANETRPITIDITGPKGYPPMDRRTISQALALKQKLTPAQRDHLQFFLADVGSVYVPPVPIASPTNDPVADYAAANITASGTDAKGVYFDLPMGRLTLTDKDASIALPEGQAVTRSTIRSTAGNADPSQLNPAEVAAVVNRVQEMSYGQPLNVQQQAALTNQLQTNAAQLVGSPGDLPALLGQVKSVTPGSPIYTVTFHQAVALVNASGTVNVTPVNNVGRPNTPKMAATPSVTLILEGLLSTGLAIYLLTIGILTLRGHRAGARLHKIYAWIKLPLTLISAAALYWLIVAGGGQVPWAALATGVLVLGGVIYPIILFCVLPTRTVKQYYAALAAT